jgi:hypothetical protein
VSNPVGEVYSVQTPAAKTRLFWLIAIFLILAPVSVSGSTSREGDDPLKWARVIVLALVTLSGLRWLQWPRKGDVAGKLLAVAAIFCAGALWSTSPDLGAGVQGDVCGVRGGRDQSCQRAEEQKETSGRSRAR